MNPATMITLAMHNIVLLAVIGSVTLLAWHGSIDGSTAVVAILAAAGINGTGTAGFLAGPNGKGGAGAPSVQPPSQG